MTSHRARENVLAPPQFPRYTKNTFFLLSFWFFTQAHTVSPLGGHIFFPTFYISVALLLPLLLTPLLHQLLHRVLQAGRDLEALRTAICAHGPTLIRDLEAREAPQRRPPSRRRPIGIY